MQPTNTTPQGTDDAGDDVLAALNKPSADSLAGANPVLLNYLARLEKVAAKAERQLASVRGNWQKAESEKTALKTQVDELTGSSERERLEYNQKLAKFGDYDTIKADLAAKQGELAKATTERELALTLTKPELQHLLPLYQANALNLRGDDGALLAGEALQARLTAIAQTVPAGQQPPQQQPQQPNPYGGFFQQPPSEAQRPTPQGSGQVGGKTLSQIQELLGKTPYGSTEYDALWGEYEKAVVLNEGSTIKNPLFE